MRRLLLVLLLVASPALAQSNGWREIQNGWGEIQAPPGYSTIPAPTGCVATSVPIFLGSPVAMGCDAGLTYDAATDTLRIGPATTAGVKLSGANNKGLVSIFGDGSDYAGFAGQGVTLQSSGYYTWSPAGDPTVAGDTYLGRVSPGVVHVSTGYGVGSGSLVVDSLQAQGSRGGVDTDIAGANLTIQSGAGTGSGAGSTLIFKTPTAHGSDTVAQTMDTRLTIAPYAAIFAVQPQPSVADGLALGYAGGEWQHLYLTRATLGSKSKAIVDATPTAFATFTIADGATYTGAIIYKIKSVKGTALHVLSGNARFAAARVGTNYYVSVGEIGSQVAAFSDGGSLSGVIGISGTGGVVTISANFDTSHSSPDTMTIDARFDSPDAGLALTFP